MDIKDYLDVAGALRSTAQLIRDDYSIDDDPAFFNGVLACLESLARMAETNYNFAKRGTE